MCSWSEQKNQSVIEMKSRNIVWNIETRLGLFNVCLELLSEILRYIIRYGWKWNNNEAKLTHKQL